MTPWTAAGQASLSFNNSQSLLKLMSIESVRPSSHLILCCPLLLLLSFSAVFSINSALRVNWSKYWNFSIRPYNEYSGLISFRIDCCPRDSQESSPAPQSKALILSQSSFFMVQLTYMTTGKTIALTVWTFVGKVMSLLFNALPRFAIAFLPRSKSLNFIAAVTIHSDSGSQENTICHSFHFFPTYLP